jgi:hypothetical protein
MRTIRIKRSTKSGVGDEPTAAETHEFAVRAARYLADHGYSQPEIVDALEEELPVDEDEACAAAQVGNTLSNQRR